jgi:hypothetical protein
MRLVLFLILFPSLAFADTYAGTWEGTIYRKFDTCGEYSASYKAKYKVKRNGNVLTQFKPVEKLTLVGIVKKPDRFEVSLIFNYYRTDLQLKSVVEQKYKYSNIKDNTARIRITTDITFENGMICNSAFAGNLKKK